MRPHALVAALLLSLAPAAPRAAAAAEGEGAEVLAAVEDLREEVARIRGLPWKERVEAEILTRDALKRRLDEMLREDLDEAEYEKAVRALRRYGMLGEGEDLLALFKAMMGEGILAYYDSETRRIYVVLGPELDALRPTIAHELVHALEDQYVGIQDFQESIEADPDAIFARTCVVEGSAERGRVLWEVAHPGLARRAREAREDPKVEEAMNTVVATTPAYLILPTQFHYQRGIAFVERVVGGDYPGGMERLYRDPPTTQEQVLHPRRYGAPGAQARGERDLPRRIGWGLDLAAAAGPGWELIDDEPSGELDFALWIDFFLGTCKGRLDMDLLRKGEWCAPEAKRSSEGWDGARAAFLRKPGEPLAIVSASAWDAPLDAREAAGAMVAALRARYGASFRGGPWAYAGVPPGGTPEDGTVRTRDYEADGVRGRVEVRDDLVLWLEGKPDDAFERVFQALRHTTAERDVRDRWTPGRAPDPFAGATWRADAHGVAWRSPDGQWTTDMASASGTRVRKGPVVVELEVHRGTLASAVPTLPAGLRARMRGGQVTPQETSVRGRSGARMTYDTADDLADGGMRHVVLLLELPEGRALVVRASAPASAKGRYAVDVEQAIDGLLLRD